MHPQAPKCASMLYAYVDKVKSLKGSDQSLSLQILLSVLHIRNGTLLLSLLFFIERKLFSGLKWGFREVFFNSKQDLLFESGAQE